MVVMVFCVSARRCLVPFVPLLAFAAAGCTHRLLVKYGEDFEIPESRIKPVPLRVGLVVPPAAAMPPAVYAKRCAFGKGIVTVPYADEYPRLARQLASRFFRSADLVADKPSALAGHDAVLELDPPKIDADSSCGFNYFLGWQIWPLLLPPSTGYEYRLEVTARLLDQTGQTLSQASFTGGARVNGGDAHDFGRHAEAEGTPIQEALSSAIGEVLRSLTTAPGFIRYRQAAHQTLVAGPERQGDAATAKGNGAQAFARYLEAYRLAEEDNSARNRLLGKLFELARLMHPSPAIPPEARNHADRAESLLRLAKDESGYGKAAQHFELALQSAPWWAEVYYNLGLTREKAGDLAGAARALNLYLKAAPDASEAAAVRKKVVDLEAALELNGASAASVTDAAEASSSESNVGDEKPAPSRPKRKKPKGFNKK